VKLASILICIGHRTLKQGAQNNETGQPYIISALLLSSRLPTKAKLVKMVEK
jgi:hypothetical protein